MAEDEQGLRKILSACWSAFTLVLAVSCILNILMLTVSIYMLQIFDRVLPSQSADTLIYLTLIALLAILLLGLMDGARSQILTRVSTWIDHQLTPKAFALSFDHILNGGQYGRQSLGDITALRQFLGGAGVYAFFDTPWIFIFLVVIFILSIPLGVIALIGAIFLFALALLNEYVSNRPLSEANQLYTETQEKVNHGLNHAESIQAMGMGKPLIEQWLTSNEKVLSLQGQASDRVSIILSLGKFLRLSLQILVLGVGAYYVMQGTLTSGSMIAASIIMGRALAPVEQLMGAWRQALGAWNAKKRLTAYFSAQSKLRMNHLTLPEVTGRIDVEELIYLLQGQKNPLLHGIQFSLKPGENLAVIGPSGAGKSTLARLLVGIWMPSQGAVRLDGVNIYHWDRNDIGNHLGYLAQQDELFTGTVKDNIARMGDINEEKVLEAAQFVGAHEMILKLDKGYETVISPYQLSGGQAKRVVLARAFYNHPKWVVLDEPENSLDAIGLQALEQVIRRSKSERITLVIISKRPDLVKLCDKVLFLQDGQMKYLGDYKTIQGKLEHE